MPKWANGDIPSVMNVRLWAPLAVAGWLRVSEWPSVLIDVIVVLVSEVP